MSFSNASKQSHPRLGVSASARGVSGAVESSDSSDSGNASSTDFTLYCDDDDPYEYDDDIIIEKRNGENHDETLDDDLIHEGNIGFNSLGFFLDAHGFYSWHICFSQTVIDEF